MEKIKKTILQAVTTGITTCTGTTGTCYTIIPDLDAVYYLKIGLEQVSNDLGFFDVYKDPIPLITYQLIDSDGGMFIDSNDDKFIL